MENLVPGAGLTSGLIAIMKGDDNLILLVLYKYGLAAGKTHIVQPFAAEFYFRKKCIFLVSPGHGFLLNF